MPIITPVSSSIDFPKQADVVVIGAGVGVVVVVVDVVDVVDDVVVVDVVVVVVDVVVVVGVVVVVARRRRMTTKSLSFSWNLQNL